MNGRHAGGRSTGLKVTVAALVVLLAGVAGAALRAADTDEPTAAPAPPSTASPDTPDGTSPPAAPEAASSGASDRSSPPAAPSTPPGAAAATPTTSPTAVPAADPSPALVRCAQSVRAGEQVLAAAEQGASNWSEHVDAYWGVVRGGVAYGAAEAAWDRTRLAGPADLKRFDAAYDRYAPVRTSCEGLPQQLPAGEAGLGVSCVQRSAAADAAVVRAKTVLDQWETHQQDMAARRSRQLSLAESRTRFRALVRQAPPALQAARDTAAQMHQAPACAVPGAD